MAALATSSRLNRATFWLPLVSLFFLWQILYLPYLRDSPTWYGDETLTLLMGRNLVAGQTTAGPIWLTYWHTYPPYQPVYDWLVGLGAALTGADILGARFVNTLCALAIALLICFLGRRHLGIVAAWFAAALFLSYGQNIIHFRWVYPHNAVALGFVVALLRLMRRSSPRNDWTAGAGLAIGALAHPMFAHGAIAAFLCRIKKPRSWPRLAIPPTAAVLASLGIVALIYWGKSWLGDDLNSLAGNYGDKSNESGFHLFENLGVFYSQDFFHLFAAIGVALCCNRRLYPIAIFASVISVLLLQNRQNLTLFYYQAIVLTPILALAWGGALAQAGQWVRRRFHNRRVALGVQLAAFLIPISLFAAHLPEVLQGKITPRNQPWTTQNIPEVETAADWINERTSPTDLVIANTNIAWLLKARSSDFLYATLWAGFPTEYFPKGLPRERFRYPVDIGEAKFVVVGDIDQRWMLGQPNVGKLVEKLDAEKWPVVWAGKYYAILANPKFAQ